MKTITEHIREHALRACGYSDNPAWDAYLLTMRWVASANW